MAKKIISQLQKQLSIDANIIEIGIDEAGRGPLFGRVYAAAVVLPMDEFKHEDMKDSKKFSSEKKITAVANYIKENAIAWGVGYSTHEEIDKINIRRATHKAMHSAINQVIDKLNVENETMCNIKLLVDGNDFTPISKVINEKLYTINFTTIEGGDNKFTPIAAASILAKVERDKYIKELCDENPELNEKYCILKNKGYGTKQHLDGIRKYGITEFHRKTFGICKQF